MKCALLLLPLVALAGCVCMTSKPRVLGAAYDKGDLERVSASKTYRWSLPAESNPYNNQAMYLGIVKSDMDAQLAKKGYQLAPGKGANADLEVSFLVVYKDEATTAIVDKYFGTNRIPERLIVASGSMASPSYEVGTLIVDAEDARDHESLWRGAVSTKVDRSKPFEIQKKRIDASVAFVMEGFPAAK